MTVRPRNDAGGRSSLRQSPPFLHPSTARLHSPHILNTIELTLEEGLCGQFTKNLMTRSDICRMMRRHAERAGIGARILPHGFRFAIATLLYARGMPVDEIQTLHRHSDVTTSSVYTRSKRGIARNIVERIRCRLM